MNTLPSPIVFFDGVCNLCNSAVNFLLDRDTKNVLKFAPLQGTTFAEAQRQFPELAGLEASIVLYENGKIYRQSAAVLRLCLLLGGFWKLLYAGIILPPPLRDALYAWVARNRYRWFGQRESCRMPTPELRAKFLD
jgi:predicted DCC family thiol-disulfide oxidoreductase YuxK